MNKSKITQIKIIKSKKNRQVIWITRKSDYWYERTKFYFRPKDNKLSNLLEKLSSSFRSETNYYFKETNEK